MDDEIDCITADTEMIERELEDLKWQNYLGPLPNEFLSNEPDTRSNILFFLGWLLSDMWEYRWLGKTPIEMAKLLMDVSDAITNCTDYDQTSP